MHPRLDRVSTDFRTWNELILAKLSFFKDAQLIEHSLSERSCRKPPCKDKVCVKPSTKKSCTASKHKVEQSIDNTTQRY